VRRSAVTKPGNAYMNTSTARPQCGSWGALAATMRGAEADDEELGREMPSVADPQEICEAPASGAAMLAWMQRQKCGQRMPFEQLTTLMCSSRRALGPVGTSFWARHAAVCSLSSSSMGIESSQSSSGSAAASSRLGGISAVTLYTSLRHTGTTRVWLYYGAVGDVASDRHCMQPQQLAEEAHWSNACCANSFRFQAPGLWLPHITL